MLPYISCGYTYDRVNSTLLHLCDNIPSHTMCCVSTQLLGSKEIQDDHEIAQVEETASAIIFAAIKDPALQKTVQLTIAPTRVHVVETEPWV